MMSPRSEYLLSSLILLSQARALTTPKPSLHLGEEGKNSVCLGQKDSRSIFPSGFLFPKDSPC